MDPLNLIRLAPAEGMQMVVCVWTVAHAPGALNCGVVHDHVSQNEP